MAFGARLPFAGGRIFSTGLVSLPAERGLTGAGAGFGETGSGLTGAGSGVAGTGSLATARPLPKDNPSNRPINIMGIIRRAHMPVYSRFNA